MTNPHMLTLVYPYYDNPEMLKLHFAEWANYPQEIKANIEAVIVDDCSAKVSALPIVKECAPQVGFPVRQFRITRKVMWNWLAARNIGAHEAKDSWLLMTDMDLMLRAEDAFQIVRLAKGGILREDAFYLLDRVIAPDGRGYKVHPNTYLMSKSLYWHIGGYDEEYAGIYGCDGTYRRLALKIAFGGHFHLHGIKVTYYPRSFVADSGVQDDGRKATREAIKNKVAIKEGANKLKKGIRPTALSFPYIKEY